MITQEQKVWKSSAVLQHELDKLPVGLSLMELGCGYSKLTYNGRYLRTDIDLACQPDLVVDWSKPITMSRHRFDGVVLADCFYDRHHPAVEHLFAWLKPGGFILIVDPCRREALEHVRQIVLTDRFEVQTRTVTYREDEYIVWHIERA